ncbi:hypothetical protein GCM10008983_17380 [Lentibacillus halophilus]|uniref:Lysozyme inhibitor LprI-like N-terminal domain-containing protein n=1 Tax=Lentibacillus halophilus TaxID=295065 RepID=A0ABN0ZA05_9BACI
MKNNHLLVFMILAAVLVLSTACGNSSDASNDAEDAQSENQHSTQKASDDQSKTNAVKNAVNDNDTDTNTNDTNSNESNNKPDEEKGTSANNTKGKKQAYLKQLNETENEMKKQQNNLEDNSTYALKAVAGNRSDAWDDHLNDIYDTLEKQLSTEQMDQLRQEQREWISNRNEQAKEASLKYEGGTQEQLEYVTVQANITKDRCFELVEDYMK